MAVTIDATNDPYIHASGTTAEVLAHLKAQNVSEGAVLGFWFNCVDTSCIYRR